MSIAALPARLALLLVLCLLCACQSTADRWKLAQAQDDTAGYRAFLDHPKNTTRSYRRQAAARLVDLGFEAALEARDRQALNDLLRKHPQHELVDEARFLLDELVFDWAVASGRVGDFTLYLGKYPLGRFRREALSRRETVAWQDLQPQPSLAQLQTFKLKYAQTGSQLSDQADALIEQLTWERVVASEDLWDLNRFLDDFPRSQHQPAARELLVRLEWEQARDSGDIRSVQRFRRDFPDSPFDEAALGVIEEDAWARVVEKDTQRNYSAFLESFPESAHAAEARQRSEDLAWAAASGGGSVPSLQRFVQDFPDSPRVAEAQRLVSLERTLWTVQPGAARIGRHEHIEAPAELASVSVVVGRDGAPGPGQLLLDGERCAALLADGSEVPLVAVVLGQLPPHTAALAVGRTIAGDWTTDPAGPSPVAGQTVRARAAGPDYAGRRFVYNMGGSLVIGGAGQLSSDGHHAIRYTPPEDLEPAAPAPDGVHPNALHVVTYVTPPERLEEPDPAVLFLWTADTPGGGLTLSLLDGERQQLSLVFAAPAGQVRSLRVLDQELPCG